MTDERVALVERLRKGDWRVEWGEYAPCDDRDQAADQIEADGKRIAELEAALWSRDKFILDQGLFETYVDTLPTTRAALRGEANG